MLEPLCAVACRSLPKHCLPKRYKKIQSGCTTINSPALVVDDQARFVGLVRGKESLLGALREAAMKSAWIRGLQHGLQSHGQHLQMPVLPD